MAPPGERSPASESDIHLMLQTPGGDQGGDHHLVCFVRAGDQVYDMDSLASKPHWVAECGDTTFPSVAITAARAYLDR